MVGKKVIEASRCHIKTCRINMCRTPPHKNTHIYTNILRAANSYVFIIIFIRLSATKLLHSVVIYTFTGLVWVQPMIQIPSGLQQEEYLVQNSAKSNMCSYLLGWPLLDKGTDKSRFLLPKTAVLWFEVPIWANATAQMHLCKWMNAWVFLNFLQQLCCETHTASGIVEVSVVLK